MDYSELFKGIAVVIDNEIKDQKANIQRIVQQLDESKIPYLKYENIPENEVVECFNNISFIILDWDLTTGIEIKDTLAGVKKPQYLLDQGIKENVDFIAYINSICYCPIFIFSNVNTENIIRTLEESSLISRSKPNNIFVLSKGKLSKPDTLFTQINQWILETPALYILKKWEQEYRKSISNLFVDFQSYSPYWPNILWKTYKSDGINASNEFVNLITQNLNTRMIPFTFHERIFENEVTCPKDELLKVLEGERFIANTNLHKDDISPGDIYKKRSHYYVNIRAKCDLTFLKNNGSDIFDTKLYLLKGSSLTKPNMKKIYSEDYGCFMEKGNENIFFPVHNGKAVSFQFKEMLVENWSDYKDCRIGRMLPPHITRLQQRYSLYIKRQGLPRLPKELFED